VGVAVAVDADRDRETVTLEELDVSGVDERAVGGHRQPHLDPELGSSRHRVLGGGTDHDSVHERLTAHEGDRDTVAHIGIFEQQVDRARSLAERHQSRLHAEVALLRVAVRTAEVAFLRDGE
jgi:hypothetical protein